MTKKLPAEKRRRGAGKSKLAGDRIRETARELFYRQGIRAVGVDEIVARAGVTKPSLYRSFASKDELAAACLRDRSDASLRRLDAALAEYPDNPRAGFRSWLRQISEKATKPDYRGCALTNAAVEYPERKHPGRLVAIAHKKALRERLKHFAARIDVSDTDTLADALLLLIEGAHATGQFFGRTGPARILVEVADALIDAYRDNSHHAVTSRAVAEAID